MSIWRAAAIVASAACLSLFVACDGSDDDYDEAPAECSSGSEKPCTCSDGSSGTKRCNSSGSDWYACDCAEEPSFEGIPLTVKVPVGLKLPGNWNPQCRIRIECMGVTGSFGPIFFGDDKEAQSDYDKELSPGEHVTLPMWADRYRISLDCGKGCSSWKEFKLDSWSSGMVWEPDTCSITVSAPLNIDCVIDVTGRAQEGLCGPSSFGLGHFAMNRDSQEKRDWVLLKNTYNVVGKIAYTNTELSDSVYGWECTDKDFVFTCL